MKSFTLLAFFLFSNLTAFAGDFEVKFESVKSDASGMQKEVITVLDDEFAEGEYSSEGNILSKPATIKYALNNNSTGLYLTLRSNGSILEYEVFSSQRPIKFNGIFISVRKLD